MKQIIFGLVVLSIVSCGHKEENSNDFDAIIKQDIYKGLTDSIKKFPTIDSLYLLRGLRLTQNKQYAVALEDFAKAWEIQKNENNGIYFGIGLLNMEKYTDATKHFTGLTQTFPDNPLVREKLGYCFERIGKPNEAINQYDVILKQDSSDHIIMATKAYALQQTGNDAEAIQWFEKSYAGIPNKIIGEELALMYAETKNPKTIAFCDNLLKSDSSENKSVSPIYAKGLYYKNTGNYAAALPLFDQCIKEDYTFPYSYLDKSVILYEQKKYDEAIKLLDIAKQNDNQNSEVYYRMGKCLEAKGNINGARLEYERALALEPDYSVAKEALEKIAK